jgi:hypothetical protein
MGWIWAVDGWQGMRGLEWGAFFSLLDQPGVWVSKHPYGFGLGSWVGAWSGLCSWLWTPRTPSGLGWLCCCVGIIFAVSFLVCLRLEHAWHRRRH